jgi:hypothetical protein
VRVPPAVATEKARARAGPPSTAVTTQPSLLALPGAIPLDKITVPSPSAPPAPGQTRPTNRAPRTPASHVPRAAQPVPLSQAPAPVSQASAPSASMATPGPIVVMEQPDGSSKMMRTYRLPDGTVMFVPVG